MGTPIKMKLNVRHGRPPYGLMAGYASGGKEEIDTEEPSDMEKMYE